MLIQAAFVNPGHCGVRDFSTLLGEELQEQGLEVKNVYVTLRGSGLKPVLRQNATLACQLIRLANISKSRGDSVSVILHYASFAGTYKGIPLFMPFLPVVLRFFRVSSVVVAHELWAPTASKLTRRVQRQVQRLAFKILMARLHLVIVTTSSRARTLSKVTSGDDKVAFRAVFSNWPKSGDDKAAENMQIIVPGWAHSDIPADLICRASRLCGLPVLLLGGGTADRLTRWREAAAANEITLNTTGHLSPSEAASTLRRNRVVLIGNSCGPMSSKGTLAASLRNGCRIVAFDGPNTWHDLRQLDSVKLIPMNAASLSQAFEEFSSSKELLSAPSEASEKFYENAMDIAGFVTLVSRVG